MKLDIIPQFFFGDPVGVIQRLIKWFTTGRIWTHLINTLVETMLGFVIGTGSGLVCGLWLALNPTLARVFDPFIKAANSMPRLPSATSWVFSSLHNAVGLAFVGAVIGEYLGSARGIGYLILQAEGVFDIDSVIAGILLRTVFAPCWTSPSPASR